MTFKIDTSNTTKDDNEYQEVQYSSWTRDNSDNKILKGIQVKDLSKITDENTQYVWDYDGYPYACASLIEDDYILATEINTGTVFEKKTVTEFWGLGKNIATASFLGVENVKREVEGITPWTKEDFTIEKKKRLQTKYINSETGERFKNPKKDTDGKYLEGTGDNLKFKTKVNKDLSDVVEIMNFKVNDVCKQWNIPKDKIIYILGEGTTMRHRTPLPMMYKGSRSGTERPIFLNQARDWVRENLNHEEAAENFESDDIIEHYAAKSTINYNKTGVHSYVCMGIDKDMLSNSKAAINVDKVDGRFKFPQALLIEPSNVSVGELELVQKKTSAEVKGSGLKWLVMQAFCVGDQADFYHPYLKFEKSIRSHIKYGDVTAYKDFVKLKSPLEVLQKAVDNLFSWFPEGLKYTDCHGNWQDIDTFSWMEMCFKTAYMTRSLDDKTTLKLLCDYFKVDYTKCVGNNIPTPKVPLDGDSLTSSISSYSEDILSTIVLLSDKSGKVADKNARLKEAIEMLQSMQGFDKLFE